MKFVRLMERLFVRETYVRRKDTSPNNRITVGSANEQAEASVTERPTSRGTSRDPNLVDLGSTNEQIAEVPVTTRTRSRSRPRSPYTIDIVSGSEQTPAPVAARSKPESTSRNTSPVDLEPPLPKLTPVTEPIASKPFFDPELKERLGKPYQEAPIAQPDRVVSTQPTIAQMRQQQSEMGTIPTTPLATKRTPLSMVRTTEEREAIQENVRRSFVPEPSIAEIRQQQPTGASSIPTAERRPLRTTRTPEENEAIRKAARASYVQEPSIAEMRRQQPTGASSIPTAERTPLKTMRTPEENEAIRKAARASYVQEPSIAEMRRQQHATGSEPELTPTAERIPVRTVRTMEEKAAIIQAARDSYIPESSITPIAEARNSYAHAVSRGREMAANIRDRVKEMLPQGTPPAADSPHGILGVKANASPKKILKAYHRNMAALMEESINSPVATERFAQLNDAMETLHSQPKPIVQRLRGSVAETVQRVRAAGSTVKGNMTAASLALAQPSTTGLVREIAEIPIDISPEILAARTSDVFNQPGNLRSSARTSSSALLPSSSPVEIMEPVPSDVINIPTAARDTVAIESTPPEPAPKPISAIAEEIIEKTPAAAPVEALEEMIKTEAKAASVPAGGKAKIVLIGAGAVTATAVAAYAMLSRPKKKNLPTPANDWATTTQTQTAALLHR